MSQTQKSVGMSKLEFTDDDIQAYLQQEGKELFGTAEGAILYEQRLFDMINSADDA